MGPTGRWGGGPDRLNVVLCADHELNVSSFTARCVASAGATPYAVFVAGLAALGGVKDGGNTERVDAFLAEAEATGSAVATRLRPGETVPGFGRTLYPAGDPRAEALLTALAQEAITSPKKLDHRVGHGGHDLRRHQAQALSRVASGDKLQELAEVGLLPQEMVQRAAQAVTAEENSDG